MTIISHNLTGKIDEKTVALLFEEADILKEEASDYDRSSAHFLGREIARMAGQATKAKLTDILEREAASSQGHKIAMDVLKQDVFQKESYEQVVEYFNALLRGLLKYERAGIKT